MTRESARDGLAQAVPPPTDRVMDPVPDDVRAAARGAFAARDRHAKVLGLMTDSLVDEEPAASAARRLTYAGVTLPGQVVVTVLEHEDGRVSLALECPWEGAELGQVQCGGETVHVQLQAHGRWMAGPAQHGLMRAELAVGDKVLHTAWVRV
jgi:hypothetical protein